MTHYSWNEAPTDEKTLEFTKDGIEQLQHDVITFLDQFDEMPPQLVDDICQTIINYYIKHRDIPPLDKATLMCYIIV